MNFLLKKQNFLCGNSAREELSEVGKNCLFDLAQIRQAEYEVKRMNDAFWLPPALEMALNELALREFSAMSEAQKQAAAELSRCERSERGLPLRYSLSDF